jgi:hypothetical protein
VLKELPKGQTSSNEAALSNCTPTQSFLLEYGSSCKANILPTVMEAVLEEQEHLFNTAAPKKDTV